MKNVYSSKSVLYEQHCIIFTTWIYQGQLLTLQLISLNVPYTGIDNFYKKS